MKKIGIIGAGFSGTMAAVHLIRKAVHPVEIILINPENTFNKGIAYTPNSRKLILNVVAGKMSAFASMPDHFLNWLSKQLDYRDLERDILSITFIPRYLYGKYLEEIWQDSIKLAHEKGLVVREIYQEVIDIQKEKNFLTLILTGNSKIDIDFCIIATGNNLPANPSVIDSSNISEGRYFRDPWSKNAISGCNPDLPVLIFGNGLTMADTVIGLRAQGFNNVIHTISRHGFNIFSHRYINHKYNLSQEEILKAGSLLDLIKLIKRHSRLLLKNGHTPEPVIDALRPHIQYLWFILNNHEKQVFLKKLNHLWNSIRHRIPANVKDFLLASQLSGKLEIHSGQILDITEQNGSLAVLYKTMNGVVRNEMIVSRIINCTGSEPGISTDCSGRLLVNCLGKNLVAEDELRLGLQADPVTLQIIDPQGNKHNNMYTLGPLLKGVLWETTTVNEIRTQAERLSEIILKEIPSEK